jgi:NADPH2:quinone reductase
VLSFGKLDIAAPGPGEVLVEVKVSAVNPTDIKRRTTGRELGRFASIIPNNDGAGIIAAVGDGVSDARVGEHVWLFGAQAGRAHGTASTKLVVPAHLAVPLPQSASFTDGACVGVPAVTAWHGVLGHGPATGKTVLITGAGGRVGRYAVQIAAGAGARVIAVSRPVKADDLKALGAHEVVDYTAPDFTGNLRAAAPDGIDHVCDGTLALTLDNALPQLNPRATIAAYASDMNPAPILPFGQLLYSNITIAAFSIFALSEAQRDAALNGVNDLLASGKLKHHAGAGFTFDQMVEAHEAVEAGTVEGTCLVSIR